MDYNSMTPSSYIVEIQEDLQFLQQIMPSTPSSMSAFFSSELLI